jgi:hypothetical protein
MYGGGTKPESYCKITVYLKHNAPLLHDNIEDLCLFGVFNTRGGSGITFLLPDKKTQEKIDKLVGQDARKAVSMINACILPIYLANISDFESHQEDIPNVLGNKLEFKKNGITSSSVELSNGAKITVDSKFKRLHETSNVAVYSLDGEVPTTGEPSQALHKKSKKKNSYDGGNDDFDPDTRGKGENYSWPQMVNEVKSMCIAKSNTNGIDYLTHMGLSLINYLLNSPNPELKSLGELLCKVHPVSPLYYLFCGCLLTDKERGEWVEYDGKYDKLETLKKHLNMGLKKQVDVSKEFKSSPTVTKFQATDICSQLHTKAKEIQEKYLPAEHFNFDRFGSVEGFRSWIMLVSEFTFLFTKQYTDAYTVNGSKKTLQNIFDIYERWIMSNCIKKNWTDTLTLVNPTLDDSLIFSKERFCTILSLFVSHRFFPMGCDIETLHNITNGNTEGIMYGDKLAPNLIIPTSDEHITAKFWIKSIA